MAAFWMEPVVLPTNAGAAARAIAPASGKAAAATTIRPRRTFG
jgi:hypothetical protein